MTGGNSRCPGCSAPDQPSPAAVHVFPADPGWYLVSAVEVVAPDPREALPDWVTHVVVLDSIVAWHVCALDEDSTTSAAPIGLSFGANEVGYDAILSPDGGMYDKGGGEYRLPPMAYCDPGGLAAGILT